MIASIAHIILAPVFFGVLKFAAINSSDPENDTIADGELWIEAATDGGAVVQYID